MLVEYQAIVARKRDENYLDSARGWCDLSWGGRVGLQLESSATKREGKVLAHLNTSLTNLDSDKRLFDIRGRPQKRNILITLSFPDSSCVEDFAKAVENRGYEIHGSRIKSVSEVAVA